MNDMKIYILDRHHILKKYDTDDNQLYFFLKRINFQTIGHSFNDTYWSTVKRGILTYYDKRVKVDYVVYTEDWKVLPISMLRDIYQKFITKFDNYRRYSWVYQWTVGYKNFQGFRNGPVPHTRKRGKYRAYRHPQTNQERRLSCLDKEFVRKSRNKTSLPTNYDDIRRSDINNKRSWKKNKKRKQWM